jgi:hypothetical protein
VIVGGESGPKARDFSLHWAERIVNDCRQYGLAVFVKQLGSKPVQVMRLAGGLDVVPFKTKHTKGGDPAEWPEGLRVREFPKGRELLAA